MVDNDQVEGDLGFSYKISKDSLVMIHHHGRLAGRLRGNKAASFELKIGSLSFFEQQQLMARLTGNYKQGNEKLSKNRRSKS